MDQARFRPAQGNGHLQRLLHPVTHMPSDNAAGIKVHHYSQINPATQGGDIGDVNDPFLIGPVFIKLSAVKSWSSRLGA